MKRSTLMMAFFGTIIMVGIFECLFYGNFQPGNRLCINELMAKGSSLIVSENSGQNEWIELYNGTSNTIQLKNYGLSDDPDEPFKWTFPEVELKSDNYLLIYAGVDLEDDIETQSLYMGYCLSAQGGIVTLTSPDGTTVDKFEYQECVKNVPYGRTLNDGKPALLNKATPGFANASNVSRYIYEQTPDILPEFSHEGGYYKEPITLSMSCPEGCSIYYSLDGSTPDFSSQLYDEPITVDNPSKLPNRYANQNASSNTNIFLSYGQDPVKKAVIIRARICRNGQFAPHTKDATFFIDEAPELTTVSLITDPENLFDYREGIYIGGIFRGFLSHTKYTEYRYSTLGNYSITGKSASRPVYIEVYSKKDYERLISQTGEMRTSGGLISSGAAVKSLRLYATSKYGDEQSLLFSDFHYTETNNCYFKQLVLRTHINYISDSLLDAFCTTLFLNNNGLCVQSYEPVIVYLNGEYWGVAELRERLNETMLANHYKLDVNDIVLLKSSHSEDRMIIKKGNEQDREDYLSLFEYATTHDMTNNIHYEYLAQRIDMDNFIRNYLAHIFFSNCDWPDNNVRAYRTKTTGNDNPYHDGKWRFPLYDMDMSCVNYEHNTLLYAMGCAERVYDWEGDEKPDSWSTQLFAGLMDNATFRKEFLKVYKEYRQTIFQPSFLLDRFDKFVAEYGSQLHAHNERWTRQSTFLGKIQALFVDRDEEDYGENMDKELARIRTFLEKRLSYMDKFIEEFYATKGETIIWE